MKKIGLTLDDKTYEKIVEIAKMNKRTPTTICGLILKLRCQWYETKEGTPIFNQIVYENIKQTTQNCSENNLKDAKIETEEQVEGITWDQFFNEMEGKTK